jgi:hypothetical protein
MERSNENAREHETFQVSITIQFMNLIIKWVDFNVGVDGSYMICTKYKKEF